MHVYLIFVRMTPKKRVRQIYLLRGIPKRCNTTVAPFWHQIDKANNVGSGILSLGPRPEKMGPEGGDGLEAYQNFGISTFCKGEPSKIGRWSLFVLCNFLIRSTPWIPCGTKVNISWGFWGLVVVLYV